MNENCIWCHGSGQSGRHESTRSNKSRVPAGSLHKCPVCGVGVRKLASHLKRAHPNTGVTTGDPDKASMAPIAATSVSANPGLPRTPVQMLPCPECGNTVSQKKLARHMARCHPVLAGGKNSITSVAIQIRKLRSSATPAVAGSKSSSTNTKLLLKKKRITVGRKNGSNIPSFLGRYKDSAPSSANPLYPASAGGFESNRRRH